MSYEESNFYCLNCGRKGIPIQRPSSRKRERFHRKKLYCTSCKITCNHVECKSDEDVREFLEAFEEGAFQEEVIVDE